ncbi:hypothetical protein B0H15DRAFT_801099 [Mycena belliarum]|uniref:Uncharacterized protein n=1 Tax=Mycena belliarum TaxID=1033014 RepID=A0AAD6U4E4_9AGAR|nr:hypothetical protein B0H15DRAFT_801099 [Mycena belliae]
MSADPAKVVDLEYNTRKGTLLIDGSLFTLESKNKRNTIIHTIKVATGQEFRPQRKPELYGENTQTPEVETIGTISFNKQNSCLTIVHGKATDAHKKEFVIKQCTRGFPTLTQDLKAHYSGQVLHAIEAKSKSPSEINLKWMVDWSKTQKTWTFYDKNTFLAEIPIIEDVKGETQIKGKCTTVDNRTNMMACCIFATYLFPEKFEVSWESRQRQSLQWREQIRDYFLSFNLVTKVPRSHDSFIVAQDQLHTVRGSEVYHLIKLQDDTAPGKYEVLGEVAKNGEEISVNLHPSKDKDKTTILEKANYSCNHFFPLSGRHDTSEMSQNKRDKWATDNLGLIRWSHGANQSEWLIRDDFGLLAKVNTKFERGGTEFACCPKTVLDTNFRKGILVCIFATFLFGTGTSPLKKLVDMAGKEKAQTSTEVAQAFWGEEFIKAYYTAIPPANGI